MDLDRIYVSALWNSVPETFEYIREHCHNFELSFDIDDINKASDSQVHDLKEFLKSHHSKIILHAPYLGLSFGQVNFCDLDCSRKLLSRFIEIGALLDCDRFIFHLLLPESEVDHDKWLGESIETFKVLNKINSREKEFCLENVFESKVEYFEDAYRILRDELSCIYRCFDLGHSRIMFGESGTLDWLNKINIEEVKQVHLHDNNGKLDEHLPLGTGSIDFQGIIRYLEDHDSHPDFTLENFDKKSLDISFEYIKEKL